MKFCLQCEHWIAAWQENCTAIRVSFNVYTWQKNVLPVHGTINHIAFKFYLHKI